MFTIDWFALSDMLAAIVRQIETLTETHNNKGPEAEKFVYDLSRDKLLEEYCLLNPYIKDSDRKEICDLMILFRDICIIVSIKNYAFTGNIERFEKKVFEKSKDQLLGAKRKLELQKSCTIIGKNLKEKHFESSCIKTYILITLNFGHELEEYKIIEREKETIIHNIDKDSFETILFEIDSVPEIVEYFLKKEAIFRKDISVSIIGKEKDLLAWFVSSKREFPKEWFNSEATEITIDISGRWDFYDTNAQTKAKRDANKISYFVDHLVKNEISNLPQCKIIGDYLMSLNRVERRLFSMSFFEHRHANKSRKSSFLSRRLILETFHDASCLMLNYDFNLDPSILDQYLQLTGEIYLYKRFSRHNKLIVIGSPRELTPMKFGYLERTEPYLPSEIAHYESVIKKFDWFTNHKYSGIGQKEYPDEQIE